MFPVNFWFISPIDSILDSLRRFITTGEPLSSERGLPLNSSLVVSRALAGSKCFILSGKGFTASAS